MAIDRCAECGGCIAARHLSEIIKGGLMGKNISHYITTRYNLSLYSQKKRPEKIKCSPDEWMAHRFRLFTSFTLPSLRGQSCDNFTWYLFMDPETPQFFKEQIEDAALSNMKIVYMRQSQLSFLKNEIGSGSDIVITSRIDNDDAWHRDYVKVIQTEYNQPTKLLEFAESYWLDIATGKIYHHDWRWYYRLKPSIGNNPTMVEWRDSAKTVLVAPHTQLVKNVRWYQFKKIPNKPYRLIVCHEHNQVNAAGDSNSKYKQVGSEVLSGFDIHPD